MVCEFFTILAVLNFLLASAFPADYENARNYAPNFRTYNFSKETMSREDPILRIVDVSLKSLMNDSSSNSL